MGGLLFGNVFQQFTILSLNAVTVDSCSIYRSIWIIVRNVSGAAVAVVLIASVIPKSTILSFMPNVTSIAEYDGSLQGLYDIGF